MSWSRVYGYFQCRKCGNRWESTNVYCHKGTKTAAYGQECKKCRVSYMPYKVENLICGTCGREKCICEGKRHLDPQKAHRRDLCDKCKAGFPCPEEGTNEGSGLGVAGTVAAVLAGGAFLLFSAFRKE